MLNLLYGWILYSLHSFPSSHIHLSSLALLQSQMASPSNTHPSPSVCAAAHVFCTGSSWEAKRAKSVSWLSSVESHFLSTFSPAALLSIKRPRNVALSADGLSPTIVSPIIHFHSHQCAFCSLTTAPFSSQMVELSGRKDKQAPIANLFKKSPNHRWHSYRIHYVFFYFCFSRKK